MDFLFNQNKKLLRARQKVLRRRQRAVTVFLIWFLALVPLAGLMAVEVVTNLNSTSGDSAIAFLPKDDFSTAEIPVVTVEVARRPFFTIFNLGTVERTVVDTSLARPDGTIIQPTYNLTTTSSGRSTLANYQFESENLTQPGEYTATFTVEENGKTQVVTKDFSWGVLVLNTTKPLYQPGETVNFGMAVLDSEGHTICDARLVLTITEPNGSFVSLSTDQGSIVYSSECGPTTVTNTPDYGAEYIVEDSGEYRLQLTATTPAGDFTIDNMLRVADRRAFDITRYGPTRVYPLANYSMSLEVVPETDYSGTVEEYVPIDFTVIDISGGGQAGPYTTQSQKITWTVDWRAGQSYTLTYEFDPPDVSPEIFQLGPARFGDFIESRQWQIASDAPSQIVAGTSTSGTAYSSMRKVVRTTYGASSKRTFVLAYTGSALILYYSDDPEAGTPTWTSVGTVITSTTHFVGSMVWDSVSSVLYLAYGRNTVSDAVGSDVYYRQVTALTGTPTLGTQRIALDATSTVNFTHPNVEIAGDSSTNKVIVMASQHADAANSSALVVRTGTLNSDNPTWAASAYNPDTWAAAANGGILGVSRMNSNKLVVFYYDGANVLAMCHGDTTDAEAAGGWGTLGSCTDNAQTTISADDPGARGAGSAVGMSGSDVVWFAWLDGTSDIGTRRYNGSSLDAEANTVVNGAANTIGPSLTTNDYELWMVYQNPSDTTQLIYQARAVADGTTAWTGTTAILEDFTEGLIYPSVAKRLYNNYLDVVYTEATNADIRHTSKGAFIAVNPWCYQRDEGTNCTNGHVVRAAVDSTLQPEWGIISSAETTFYISQPASNAILTVFKSGVADANEAVAVHKYDGSGDVSLIILYEEELSLTVGFGSSFTIANNELDSYDNSVSGNEDIFFDVDVSNDLYVDATSQSSQEKLNIEGGVTYQPGGNAYTHDLDNFGTITAESNTIYVSGSLVRNATYTAGTSTIIFTATTGTETVSSAAALDSVTFGQSSGTATWNLSVALNVDSNLTIDYGTLGMNGNRNINVAGNLLINANGSYTKSTGTFTFDGSGTSTWTDNNASLEDMGTVSINGSSKTINLGSSVNATTVNVAGSQTFGLGSSGYVLTILGSGQTTSRPFIVSGTLNEGTNSTVKFTGTSATDIQAETYYHLELAPAGTVTHRLAAAVSQAVTVSGDLTVGNGANALTADVTSFDPTLNVIGSVTINASAILTASNSGTFNVYGGWINAGTFTHSSGTVSLLGGNVSGSVDTTFNNLNIGSGLTTATVTVNGTDDPTVAGTLTVDSGDTLSIGSSRSVTPTGAANVAGTGTISGSGRLVFIGTSGGPGTTITTLSAIVRYYATDGDIASTTVDIRTYASSVEFYNSSVTNRTITLAGGGTYTLSGASSDFSVTAFSNGNLNIDGATNNPAVTIGGDLFFVVGLGSGIPSITSGSGIWTISGSANFTSGTYTASTNNTLLMNGTGTLTTDSNTLYNLQINSSGTVTLAAATHTVAGDLLLGGTGTPVVTGSTVTMTGTANYITGGKKTLNNLTINPTTPGTITLQTSDLDVDGTLTVAGSDALTIDTSRLLTHAGATLSLSGTINGPGRLEYQSATAFPTGGALASNLILKFNTVNNDQTMSARTDYQLVEIDNSSTTVGRTVTAGSGLSQTITITGTLSLLNSGINPSTTIFEVNTYDPTFTVTGNVSIAANSTFSASSGPMSFGAGFSNSGGFTHNSGRVSFTTSTTAVLAGATTFYDFNVQSIGAAKTITFPDSATQVVQGTWTLTGAAGQLITLQSSSSPTQWTINPTAAAVSYVQVSDSNNIGVSFCATYSTDTGDNNTNWQVSGGATCGIDISGTSDGADQEIDVAVNDTLQAQTTTQGATWTISGVTVNTGDIVTVFINKEDTTIESTGVTQYDGTGNIDGMVLNANVLTIGSDDNASLDLTELGLYDMDDSVFVMHTSNDGTLTVDGNGEYTAEKISVLLGNTLTMADTQTLLTYDVENLGTLTTVDSTLIRLTGSWVNTGTFDPSGGMVNFQATTAGEIIEAGSSSFNNVSFDTAGEWTIQTNNLTALGDFSVTDAAAFVVDSGITLEVQGAFTLTASGSTTTWTGSTLYLNGSGGMYNINNKTHGGDIFDTLRVGASEDIAMWDSSASTYTIDAGGCLFSQDHGTTAGRLNIYGTCSSRANEYWSYAKDFDGAVVTRQANVQFASGASLTVDNGDSLEIVGQSAGANRTVVTRQSSGNYGLTINGTINAQYYDFDYLNASGLDIGSTATVTELSDGSFDNAAASSNYITVTSTTSTKNFFNNVFDDPADGADANVVYNVKANGANIKWTFFNWSGSKGGEGFDSEASNAYVGWFSEMTMSVSDILINLGVLNTLLVGSGSNTLTVTTNAENGYTCYAVEDGPLSFGGNDIDDVGDGTVNAGSEEYGISCSGADCDLTGDNAVSGSPLQIASNAGRVTASATTVSYKAAASSATVGGNYAHIITITCGGDF